MNYNVHEVEKKWQHQWKQNPEARTKPVGSGKKYYCLDMFPYPSGSGLHVGHWRGYVLSDVYARIKWLQGYNVLHPMGWDAFGLPAENDAIKKGIHPATSTAKNIANFKEQLQVIAAIYDWDKELNTTDSSYYRWTQWIFLKMFERGLAYEAQTPINWCPSCLTGLANEEVINGDCERCGTAVEQRNVRQWILKITEYAQKLLDGLETLDWPEKVKAMQRNWIGRSEGIELKFTAQVVNKTIDLPIYTTRLDTLYGVTFVAIAADHPLVDTLVQPEQKDAVAHYQKEISYHSDMERVVDKDKTGVFSGTYAVNPINQTKVPLYIANYVLKSYGTGIVMGVPAHDERDHAFAQRYNIPVIPVISADNTLINSDNHNGIQAGLPAIETILKVLAKDGKATKKIHYKLRDWVFSRQRYWGEPIPLIHCKHCGVVPVPEDQLPVTLPDVEQYQPTGTGESPLAAITDWVNTQCPRCKGPGKRETNTMPQWAGSCWYFLRYPNPHNDKEAFSQGDMHYWLPVDLYVGGIEHAILHLLYARFYVKVLHDAGYLPFDEPFKQLFNQGMIVRYSEKSGHVEKMSKSKGNVVNPDDIVATYGSDVLRMYILFMGPPELDAEWQDNGLEGIKRFANRVYNYFINQNNYTEDSSEETKRIVHKAMREFQERIDLFKPNTALATLMELMNTLYAQSVKIDKDLAQKIITSFAVLAPHMGSELCEKILQKPLSVLPWPTYDQQLTIDDTVTISIQVNGKLRSTMIINRDVDQKNVEERALHLVSKWVESGIITKIIYISNKLINIVVKSN